MRMPSAPSAVGHICAGGLGLLSHHLPGASASGSWVWVYPPWPSQVQGPTHPAQARRTRRSGPPAASPSAPAGTSVVTRCTHVPAQPRRARARPRDSSGLLLIRSVAPSEVSRSVSSQSLRLLLTNPSPWVPLGGGGLGLGHLLVADARERVVGRRHHLRRVHTERLQVLLPQHAESS